MPDLGIEAIRAKLDTGARTSALHAWDEEVVEAGGRTRIRFSAHPFPGNERAVIRCEAPVTDRRWVRNSGGDREQRYVIETTAIVGSWSWPIELTLTSRETMRFPMLLGREAMRRRLVVNPACSFQLGGRPGRLPTRGQTESTRRSAS